jgi:hypothetical protein
MPMQEVNLVKTYTCIRCGKKFEAVRKTAVCTDCHTAVCVVCGNVFNLKQPWTQKTCSRKCTGIYVKQSGISKSRTIKALDTLKRKYDVDNISELQHFKKICKYCGKAFETNSARREYCYDKHYGPCPVCGKQVEIKEMSIGPQACSEECRQKRIQSTSLERYGSTNVFSSEYGRDAIKTTIKERYGVDHYSKTDEFRDKFTSTMMDRYGTTIPRKNADINKKAMDTCIDRYGGESPTCDASIAEKARETVEQNFGGFGMASPELRDRIIKTKLEKYGGVFLDSEVIREKYKDTMLERYGVENPADSDEISELKRATSLSRYGTEYPIQSDIVKSKIVETNTRLYGVENVFSSPIIKESIKKSLLDRYGVDCTAHIPGLTEKKKATNLAKYGTEWYNSSKRNMESKIIDSSKVDVFMKFRDNPKMFIETMYTYKPTLTEVARDTGVTLSTISLYVNENSIQHLIDYHKSMVESDIVDVIRSIDSKCRIIRNDRKLISPYEIDIYLPEYRIGIECNPTVTHNSSIGDPWTNEPKDYKYHQMKSILAEQNGIFLFHIFGYEWTHRKDVIKSMLASLLGKSCDKIYARKCYVSEIDFNMCRDFLNQNHRQGSMSAKVRLGLFVDDTDELVSVMTFNHIRKTLGKKFDDDAWELSRFCSKLNTSVVGGASKLLRYFIDNYDYDRIISYSDVAHTRGNLYPILGFTPNRISSPRYVWVNLSDDTYLNRVSCQKSNMHRLFPNESIDLSKTERQIMEEHGYVRVYDSGTIRWEYKKKSG